MSKEDMETWLAEVDLAYDYINKLKNNEISIEELDRKDKIKEEEKKKKELKQQKLEEEKEEKIRLGREGKGGEKNYVSFCKHCFREYERETLQCLHCKHNTIPMEQRHQELLQKVDEFKQKKNNRVERKKKWELWKKTKAMLWKKSSTNYSKWDVFTSSSDEEKQELDPVLPKNDPNFQAMEKDIEERAAKRKVNRKKAEALKIQANEFMSQKNYQKAIDLYTEALDLSRDYIVLYTNRALAYIKIKKFKNVIEDCTKVTDYCECFEDGYLKSKDTCTKALLRRALANKELGKYYESRQDLREVLKLAPQNQEATKLFDEVQFLEEHKKQADRILQQKSDNNNNNGTQDQQQQQSDSKESSKNAQEKEENSQKENMGAELKDMKSVVNSFIKTAEPKPEEIAKFCNYMNTNEDAKIYFFEQKGNQKLIEMLKKDVKNICLLLNFFLQNNFIYQEDFLKKKGLDVLFAKITTNLSKIKPSEKTPQVDYDNAIDALEDYFEILVTLTNQEKMRIHLNESTDMAQIIADFMPIGLDQFQNEPEILSSFISFVSNLCYGASSAVKKLIEKQQFSLYPKFQEIVSFSKHKTSFETLKVNIYNFLSNLLTEPSVRGDFYQHKQLIQTLISQFEQFNFSNNRWVPRAEALLAVFINAAFQPKSELIELLFLFKLSNKLERFLFSSKSELYRNVTTRTLQTMAKLKFTEENLSQEFVEKIIKNYFSEEAATTGLANHALRLVLNFMEVQSDYLQKIIKPEIVKGLCSDLVKIILGDDMQRFCNGCNLGGKIVQIFSYSQPYYMCLIEKLLFVVKEKIGLERKNAAIFIAKLAKNEDNLNVIRELHGIEILHSLSQYLL